MLIERPQAVNTKYLEGKKENSALEIGQPGQAVFVIYSIGVPAIEGTVVGERWRRDPVREFLPQELPRKVTFGAVCNLVEIAKNI